MTLKEAFRKPIIMPIGIEHNFTYKYIRKGYLDGTIAIEFQTDLSKKDFERLLDVGFSQKEIDKYELV